MGMAGVVLMYSCCGRRESRRAGGPGIPVLVTAGPLDATAPAPPPLFGLTLGNSSAT